MKSRPSVLFLNLILTLSLFVSSQTTAQSLMEKLDAIASLSWTQQNLPGMSIAIQIGDSLVLEKGYGYADLENNVEATPETVYRVGSVTKQFTAAAILKLVDAGKLDLEDSISLHAPIDKYLGPEISLHHLLSHTSGLEEYVSLLGDRLRLPSTPQQIVDLFITKPLSFPPGEGWRYSNSGYYLLGLAVESASGLEYSTYLDRELFQPLGLNNTEYCNDSKLIPSRASGYKSSSNTLLNTDPIDMSVPFSAGALCSTALDLVKWSTALYKQNVISEEMTKKMLTPVSVKNSDYGYGLYIENLDGRTRVSHDGGIFGFTAFLAHYPEQEVTISILTNLQEAPVEAISLDLAKAIFATQN